jgi:hypothetical protein
MHHDAVRHQCGEQGEIEIAAYRLARGVGHCGDRQGHGGGVLPPISNRPRRPRKVGELCGPLCTLWRLAQGVCGAEFGLRITLVTGTISLVVNIRKEVIQCLIVIRRGRRLA